MLNYITLPNVLFTSDSISGSCFRPERLPITIALQTFTLVMIKLYFSGNQVFLLGSTRPLPSPLSDDGVGKTRLSDDGVGKPRLSDDGVGKSRLSPTTVWERLAFLR